MIQRCQTKLNASWFHVTLSKRQPLPASNAHEDTFLEVNLNCMIVVTNNDGSQAPGIQ